jgi:peroxiredoxin
MILVLSSFSGCVESSNKLDFSYLPKNPKVNDEIEFNIINSEDVQEYFWDFGDGSTSNESSPVHTYPSNGSYNVSLKVTYLEGNIDSISKTIFIDSAINLAPTKPNISYYSVSSWEPFLVYTFNFTSDDENGDKIKYEIDWGDGDNSFSHLIEPGFVQRFWNSWNKSGFYNVRAKAIDEHGLESNWSQINVSIGEQGLAPDFTVPTLYQGNFTLSSYRGNVVLLEFVMISCGACEYEIEELKKLYEDLEDQIEMISIYLYGVENLSSFKDEQDANWTFGINENASIAKKYILKRPVVPTLFIIDKDGFISYSNVGYVEKSKLEEEINKII